MGSIKGFIQCVIILHFVLFATAAIDKDKSGDNQIEEPPEGKKELVGSLEKANKNFHRSYHIISIISYISFGYRTEMEERT